MLQPLSPAQEEAIIEPSFNLPIFVDGLARADIVRHNMQLMFFVEQIEGRGARELMIASRLTMSVESALAMASAIMDKVQQGRSSRPFDRETWESPHAAGNA